MRWRHEHTVLDLQVRPSRTAAGEGASGPEDGEGAGGEAEAGRARAANLALDGAGDPVRGPPEEGGGEGLRRVGKGRTRDASAGDADHEPAQPRTGYSGRASVP